MPKIGAHVSASVSLELSIKRATEIGAQCTQIFISPPQQWLMTPHSSEEISSYKDEVKKTGISPNFIHGTYLINLAAENEEHLIRSIDWLKYALSISKELETKGVIFHTGSHKGAGFEKYFTQITRSIKEILNSTKESFLVMENAAGSGGVIGSFEELGQILKAVKDNRLKICLDTQHAFSRGYDLTKDDGLASLIFDIESNIGWDNLVAIHCNDSKVERGSLRDRHANIGEGFIGKEAFRDMLNHPNFKDLPFILEVPGFSGNGPDKENIDILKDLMSTIKKKGR